MKRVLLSTCIFLIVSIPTYSQSLYGLASVTKNFDGVTGVDIDFSNDEVNNEGFKANEFEDTPIIDINANDGYGTLTVKTIEHDPSNVQWWTYSGNLQYIYYDNLGVFTPFDLHNNGKATIVVEVPIEMGIAIKLDSVAWVEGTKFPALIKIDTINVLNTPVSITVDFVDMAKNDPKVGNISSQEYSAFYVWFWAIDGTKQPVTIYSFRMGELNPVSIEEVAPDGGFADVLTSGNIASIEVTNILGQAVEVVESIDQISAEGFLVLKVTKNDGSEVTGKIIK